jgi:hypothetical protein
MVTTWGSLRHQIRRGLWKGAAAFHTSRFFHREATVTYTLSEVEICALLRVLYRQHISSYGVSGPVVSDLLNRIVHHVGRERYAEYVSGQWPERLKVE